ncbi:MAG: hypothetical protein Q8M83_02560 [bacterium]|nr:hypothetical protein [bacterium]
MKKRILVLHLIGIAAFWLLYDPVLRRLPFQTALIMILIVAVMSNWRLSLLWTIILGVLLDSSSITPSGVFLTSLGLVYLTANFFLWHFLPHDSLYSLLIILPIGTLIFEFSRLFFSYLLQVVGLADLVIGFDFWYLLKVLIVNTLVGLLIFLLLYYSRRLWHKRFI